MTSAMPRPAPPGYPYALSFQIRSHRRRSVRFSESFQRGKADWSVWTHLVNTKVVPQPKTLQSFRGIKASSAAKALQPGGASIGASSLKFSQRLFQTFTRVRGQIFATTLASLLGKSCSMDSESNRVMS